MTELILPLHELNLLLITEYLDPLDDYKNINQINKYNKKLIKNNKFYKKLKEIHEKKIYDYDFKYLNKNQKYFTKACYYGYIDIVKYLYKKYQLNIHVNSEIAFRYSCGNGHKDQAQWLYNISKIYNNPLGVNTKININAYNENAFRDACFSGHKDIADKNNMDDNNTKININANDENAFIWSCCNGHKDIAEWLYNLSIKNNMDDNNTKINININNELAFSLCCDSHHEDMAEWLYNLSIKNNSKININIYNDIAFFYVVKMVIKIRQNGYITYLNWMVIQKLIFMQMMTMLTDHHYIMVIQFIKIDNTEINIDTNDNYIFGSSYIIEQLRNLRK